VGKRRFIATVSGDPELVLAAYREAGISARLIDDVA
jgi:hypothetical protein